ncbi:hypothetical protein [Allofournierella massiliensis]|uniref:Alternative ribosome-rescue factor n=1 Tax=Allofournierella massiliensis TaxID=1650663 RepID=A0ABT7USI7_9FIRM|nr:hypothetical protein [Fournierella massiliensis]MDM8201854.1 hypothetical protein [Fournierella massiliensis]
MNTQKAAPGKRPKPLFADDLRQPAKECGDRLPERKDEKGGYYQSRCGIRKRRFCRRILAHKMFKGAGKPPRLAPPLFAISAPKILGQNCEAPEKARF